jgi:hypothetical protein
MCERPPTSEDLLEQRVEMDAIDLPPDSHTPVLHSEATSKRSSVDRLIDGRDYEVGWITFYSPNPLRVAHLAREARRSRNPTNSGD